jgi:hypothetical protein
MRRKLLELLRDSLGGAVGRWGGSVTFAQSPSERPFKRPVGLFFVTFSEVVGGNGDDCQRGQIKYEARSRSIEYSQTAIPSTKKTRLQTRRHRNARRGLCLFAVDAAVPTLPPHFEFAWVFASAQVAWLQIGAAVEQERGAPRFVQQTRHTADHIPSGHDCRIVRRILSWKWFSVTWLARWLASSRGLPTARSERFN